ncbi:MAG TPA: hypothetical protein VGV92_05645 [Gammaproteobacteria bacterium]|nr:hypothetical protein [Gammaproteobacteria bacterium]
MLETKPDYYLSSNEIVTFAEPRKCWLIRRLTCGARNNLALVKVFPEVRFEGKDGNELVCDEFILANRFEGSDIWKKVGFPIEVYICALKEKNVKDFNVIAKSDMDIVAWGELYPSEESATQNLTHEMLNVLKKKKD